MMNRMKAKFAADEPAFGLSVMIPSPQVVESAAGLGFDWVLIDCEHGTVGLETMELMVMAAEASGVTPIVRPRTNAAEDILHAMDRGAQDITDTDCHMLFCWLWFCKI
jgi:4-hydroxy-2-oxoheptanedioate aldolase